MKNKFRLLASTFIVCLAIVACDELIVDPVSGPEIHVDDTRGDSIKLGQDYIYPLEGYLTNVPAENFEYGGRMYYCFLLKLEKPYPVHIIYPNNAEGFTDLSYSVNFKFFTEQKDGPIDESWSVALLNDLISYYKALDQRYAADKKTIAFLYGDRSFDANLDANEYINYLKSHIRIKQGTVHIKKLHENYLISFDGETETNEKVNLHFNDKMILDADHQLESHEKDFSTTEAPENYILKEGKYYKLKDGYYYVFKSSTYEGKTFQTVKLINWRDYYWYDYNYYSHEAYAGLINQHWKSNAIVLQFQPDSFNYFQSGTYQVASSKGIHSVGYFLSDYHGVPFEGFPNDSLVIGYYHIALNTPFTLTYDEDPNYMENQIALQSGQLTVTAISPDHYEFKGNFTDDRSQEVKVRFTASPADKVLGWVPY